MLESKERRFVLLTTSIASFLTPFTSSLISFAIPEIGEFFNANFIQVVWVPLSFLIAMASFMIPLGKISDEYGRVQFFRLGFIIILIVSLLIYFSLNIYMLIGLVFLIGIGSALISTNSTAIISYAYPQNIRGFALGINAMSVYLGLTIAPFLGGILLQYFKWQVIFLINIPIALTSLLLSFFSMKHLNIKQKATKLDITGTILFTITLLCITLYLSVSQIFDWFYMIYLLFMSIIFFIAFIFLERKSSNPLLDLSLFMRNRTFTAANLTAFLNYTSTFSIVFVFSIYLQVILKYTPFTTGMILISEPIFMVIFSPISGKLSDKYGSREIAAIGMGLIGIAFTALAFLNIQTVWDVIIPLSIIGIGFGLFSAPNTHSVMSSVTENKFGIASGTLGTMRFTGQLASIVLASTILASSLPKAMLLKLFSGFENSITLTYFNAFISGFKEVMLVSGILSLIGVYTSLLKTKIDNSIVLKH
jgi:EmrB/QacA subfamily drug resistance transporter